MRLDKKKTSETTDNPRSETATGEWMICVRSPLVNASICEIEISNRGPRKNAIIKMTDENPKLLSK